MVGIPPPPAQMTTAPWSSSQVIGSISRIRVAIAMGSSTTSPPPELGARKISSVRPSTEIVSSGLPHSHRSFETTTLSPSW
jgi:hypothetical protein